MKIKFILTTFFSLAAYCLFCSLNSGAAYGGLGDLTGSPLSTMTCSGGGCHAGGNYGTFTSIQVLDSTGNSVSNYRPGETYTLEINISSSTGSPAGYGAQAVVLDSANAQAGNLDSIQTLNTRITPWNGRQYLEQYGLNSGSLRVHWTAPAPGRGEVTIYAAGIAVDGWGNMTDDEPSATVSLSLNEAAGLYYSQNAFCNNAANSTAFLTGLNPGGSFSAVPPGLVFADSLGTIDLSASDTGIYSIYYNENGNLDSTTLRILQSDWAEINFPPEIERYFDGQDSIYILALTCTTDPTPFINGTNGGYFYSDSSKVVFIDSTTGEIDMSQTLQNFQGNQSLFNIIYVTPGICTYSDTVLIQLTICESVQQTSLSHLYLFPNPSSNGIFYLENKGETSETSLEIYNSQGQKIAATQFWLETGSLYPLSLPEKSAAGLYFLRLRQGQMEQSFKLLHE